MPVEMREKNAFIATEFMDR